MSAGVNSETLRVLIAQVADDMAAHKDALRELDARIGDGDLGLTIELGFGAIKERLSTLEGKDAGTILSESGEAFLQAASSTFGVLAGNSLVEAGKAIPATENLTRGKLLEAGRAMIATLKELGGADVGEKTLLDSLVPAFDALEAAENNGASLEETLDAVTQAAEKGMQATIELKSRYGRAAWQGDKSIGVQDPGATAVFLLVQACAARLRGL